ncbi:MAG: hypothetical protein KDK99_17560, partial [Verrucomicrobiales bacterium]|nr:hypothetical protein [Verrucomicrobiales bacterium]
FNQLGINPAKVAGELDNMTKRARKAASPPAEALATESPAEEAARTRLDAEVRAALAPLAPLTRVRRVAADASAREDEKRSQVLKTLTWAIGIAVVTLGLAEDWQPVPGTGSPWVRWIQAGLLGTALLAALVSGLTFWEYRRRGGEEDRHDFRALAEGLRVQFYWCLTGSGHSVSAEYMQRQRNELDWIRYAIASITFPYERWQRRFTAFSKDLRVRLLEIARLDWIGEQHGYFVKKVRELGVTAQGWHLWAWACGAAGLIHVALHFISKLSHPVEAALRGHGMAAGAAMLLAGCLLLPQREKRWILLGVRPQQAAEKSRPRSATFADHVFGSAAIWGGGLMLAGLVMLATHCLGQCLDFFPQWENTWTFFSGLMLVLGGSALAFAERCFLAEHLRQYAAMENLFGCASRRLEELMKHYQTAAPGSEVEQRALLEIQDLLHRVGLEALDENAEWLILHRAKPMEPMMGA